VNSADSTQQYDPYRDGRGDRDGYRGDRDGRRGDRDGYRGDRDGYRGDRDGYRGDRGMLLLATKLIYNS
jgi:hypothetical protein